jgi:glycosyltransferase involved in cell wall biosynthesis
MVNASLKARTLMTFLDKIGTRLADKIVVMSYPMKEFLIKKYGATEEKITVLWGPVDVEKVPYHPLPLRNRLVVGYAGRDSFWQGVDIILSALDKLRGRKDIEFILVGLSSEKYARWQDDNVKFKGVIPREKVPEILSGCDVLLSTRIKDPTASLQYPHKLSGYLAVGRPVIVTDVGDQGKIVEEAQCGMVIEPDNPDALIGAILKFSKMDRRKLQEMGENSRRFAETELSIAKLRQKLFQFYDS